MTRAVERAAQILLSLASGSSRLGVSEISELVDIPKPTVHTMLRTLERHGLVEQEVEGGKYALGPAVLQLGNAYLDGSELRARAASWADPLARQTGEAVWVGVLSGPNVVVVDRWAIIAYLRAGFRCSDTRSSHAATRNGASGCCPCRSSG